VIISPLFCVCLLFLPDASANYRPPYIRCRVRDKFVSLSETRPPLSPPFRKFRVANFALSLAAVSLFIVGVASLRLCVQRALLNCTFLRQMMMIIIIVILINQGKKPWWLKNYKSYKKIL